MTVQVFIDSFNQMVDRFGPVSTLDLEIVVEDRMTGDFIRPDEIAIDGERQQLRFVINSEAAEVSGD